MPMIDILATPATPAAMRTALDTLRPTLLAIPANTIPVIRLHLRSVCDVVEGALGRTEPFHADLRTRFGADAERTLELLPTLVGAARQADVEYRAARRPGALSALAEDARATHKLLFDDGETLVNHKRIPSALLDDARDTQSYEALVASIRTLSQRYREHWAMIDGNCLLTLADLDRAEAVATALEDAERERDQGPERARRAELRARALYLLVDTYEELRAMLAYVRRRAGDADKLAPSPYARDGSSRADDETDTPSDDVPPATGVTVPNNGGGPFIR